MLHDCAAEPTMIPRQRIVWGHQLDAEASSWMRNVVSINPATPSGTADADCHK
jgi:hypothetical protein